MDPLLPFPDAQEEANNTHHHNCPPRAPKSSASTRVASRARCLEGRERERGERAANRSDRLTRQPVGCAHCPLLLSPVSHTCLSHSSRRPERGSCRSCSILTGWRRALQHALTKGFSHVGSCCISQGADQRRRPRAGASSSASTAAHGFHPDSERLRLRLPVSLPPSTSCHPCERLLSPCNGMALSASARVTTRSTVW